MMMIFPDDNWNYQVKSYNKSLSRNKRNDSITFQYSITHIEIDISGDTIAENSNDKERNEEKTDEKINLKRPYDESCDDYFFADIPDNDNIVYYEFTRNNNNVIHNTNNNHVCNDKKNTKKKKTLFNIVYSLLPVKYRLKII